MGDNVSLAKRRCASQQIEEGGSQGINVIGARGPLAVQLLGADVADVASAVDLLAAPGQGIEDHAGDPELLNHEAIGGGEEIVRGKVAVEEIDAVGILQGLA